MGSLKFEANPASAVKTPLPCGISLSRPRVTGTAPNHSHLGVENNKLPQKIILEAKAIPKSQHDNDVRTTGKRILDPVGRTEFANQPSNALLLSAEAVEHSRPWTCVSTGYGAMMPKVNSITAGNLERRTWQITSPSITQPHTTGVYAPLY